MTSKESVAYLKGLMDGLDFDEGKKETKMFNAVIQALEGLVEDVDDMTEGLELLADQIDAIDEDLDTVEEFVFDDECEDEDCDCCDVEYEVECPACSETFCLDEETLLSGDVLECPACGETFRVGLEGLEMEEESDIEE
ncbi:MAG: zinc-ribbon domain-containing protein [Clostridiales bacterium]|nr:zinc-ribbon domain-containing protein [Clostridiales bacterium]